MPGRDIGGIVTLRDVAGTAPATLGRTLKLPAFLQARQTAIAAALPALD